MRLICPRFQRGGNVCYLSLLCGIAGPFGIDGTRRTCRGWCRRIHRANYRNFYQLWTKSASREQAPPWTYYTNPINLTEGLLMTKTRSDGSGSGSDSQTWTASEPQQGDVPEPSSTMPVRALVSHGISGSRHQSRVGPPRFH